MIQVELNKVVTQGAHVGHIIANHALLACKMTKYNTVNTSITIHIAALKAIVRAEQQRCYHHFGWPRPNGNTA